MKNKKLFAILTLVCFMFTLMPVAAFAAGNDTTLPAGASIEASAFATNAAEATTVVGGDKVGAHIAIKNIYNQVAATTADNGVYVWAETVSGQVSDALIVTIPSADDASQPAVGVAPGPWGSATGLQKGAYCVQLGNYANGVTEIELSFARAGQYVLKASTQAPVVGADVSKFAVLNGAVASKTTVKVDNPTTETENWAVGVKATGVNYVLTDGQATEDVAPTEVIKVDANGVKEETVKLTVLGDVKEGKRSPVAGYPVKVDTNSSNIEIDAVETVYADHNGEVEFKIAGLREGVYFIYATVGEVDVTIEVQVGSSIASDIAVVEAPEAPVATDEENYDELIQFEVTDVNGNVVNDTSIGKCTDDITSPYVTILEQPAASKIKDKEIKIKKHSTEDVYVLDTAKSFDKEGTYSVKVILDNGKSAVVTWEVKKFQTPVEIVIDAPEVVELDTTFGVELVYVDVNGVEKTAEKDAALAVSGYAVEDVENLVAGKASVDVKKDEKYAGSTIKLTAVSERYSLVAVKEVAVAKEATEIVFEDDTLEVNVNNKVEWNVVDEDGKAVTLNNIEAYEIKYIVLDKPEDAKVAIYDATGADFDGDGVMALTSNKVGNVTVQVVAKLTYDQGEDNDARAFGKQTNVVKYYTGTEIFAVGTEGKGDVVVMSIGSNEIVINDAKAAIDAAPIVENNRTFVPFRALAEAFGATVAYDEATQAVTAELNGVTVVMTIGSAEYTVNGEAATMDVAPFINGSRTMVPVRFAAEAFGIKVIPTYDENGATADILFNL